ncbi:LysM peptidoglycan-binding domain-containing M23 family metallopeptidase [Neosynechococcus sphagnicola]|uniref:LysM peptidoglycan-binding domain-containing M23 family metallopeptidase n=1 Tax=Neosynechococcus sphagnicola TaxID=1501145 RepID=UPI000565932B|nr:M23 family metallopeptidase [Neosynechococcus sphagnicola]
MTARHWLFRVGFFLTGMALPIAAAQSPPNCPLPALERFVRHRVIPGETLAAIAQRYNLIPATLMGLNPTLRQGRVTPGQDIWIPPYNGIRVAVSPGQTWQAIARAFQVRPDTLFEVNGCQPNPQVVFVPGVNWSPNQSPAQPLVPPATALPRRFPAYPLAVTAPLLMGYGWQLFPRTGEVAFHSGWDLAAPLGAAVQAVDRGVVAFAGSQGVYGQLVVVNHPGGLQTRYAQLDHLAVKTGQQVQAGDRLGTVGTTGTPSLVEPHLHFEVRHASTLGWVAADPQPYLGSRRD